MKRAALSIILCCLAILPAHAEGGKLADVVGGLKICYRTAALRYGANKCDPPPALTPAVYGKCAKEEEDLSNFMTRENAERNSGLNAQEAARNEIKEIKRGWEPQIQSWILDAQIESGQCRQPAKDSK